MRLRYSDNLLATVLCVVAAVGISLLIILRPEGEPLELIDVQSSEALPVVDQYLHVPTSASHVYVRRTFGRTWYLFARFTLPPDDLGRCPDDGDLHPEWKYKPANLNDTSTLLSFNYESVLPPWFDVANIKSGAAFVGEIANPNDAAQMFIDSESSTVFVLRVPHSSTARIQAAHNAARKPVP